MPKIGFNVGYGHHCMSEEAMIVALGYGINSVFFYVGDKNLDIPDKIHAFDISELDDLRKKILKCIECKEISSIKEKIQFIG